MCFFLVSVWVDVWEEREQCREKEREREDTVRPLDPLRLRPSLLCGLAGRISVSTLWLILVSLAVHLLLNISKLIHLLEDGCRGKRHKTVMWQHQLVSMLSVVFSFLPLVVLIERLKCWKSWICATYSIVFHKDRVMNSFNTAGIWILDEPPPPSNCWKYCNPSLLFYILVTSNSCVGTAHE